MLAFDRRHFLSSLTGAAGALLAGPGHDRNSIHAAGSEPKPEIRITDVKTAMLEVDWGWRRRWMLIRIDTDQGISGYGETWANDSARAHVLGYRQMLLGEDPTEVERLFRRMMGRAYSNFGAAHFDSGVAVHAASGVETALWDIAGKALGAPVYKLLGGKHWDRVRLYCCVGGLQDYIPMADVYKELGITCLKFDATPPKVLGVPGAVMDRHLTRKGLSRLVSQIEDIRREVGEEVEISVEARCGTLSNAMRYLKAVEPFDLTWVEDPIPATDVEAWATLTASSHTPTLVGEGLHLRHEFLEFFRRSATRLVAPDIQVSGGIAESKKIADLADIHHLQTCPHNASSAIGIAAAVHSCAAMPNLLALEFHAMPGWERILKGYRPKISNGFIDIPEGPGLGVELDEEETRKYLMEGESWFGA